LSKQGKYSGVDEKLRNRGREKVSEQAELTAELTKEEID
jgi:hypothetical protein